MQENQQAVNGHDGDTGVVGLVVDKVSDIDNSTSERRAIAEQFLKELGAGLKDQQRVVIAQKDEVDGGFPTKPFNNATVLQADKNIYACIAGINPSEYKDSGRKTWARRKEHIAAGLALMVDDVGTGKGSKGALTVDMLAERLMPTAVVETSPDNFQVWYFFDKPETDVTKFKNLIVSFVGDVLKDGGDKLDDPVRIARVPFGVNTKRTNEGALKYPDCNDKPWFVRLKSSNYDLRYSVDQIAAAFNVEIRQSPKYEKREVKTLGNSFDDAVLAAAVKAYRAADAIAEDRSTPGKYRIKCPWGAEHSSGNGLDAFIAGPEAGMDNPYLFSCSHSTCKEAKRGWTAFVREIGVGDQIESVIYDELARVNAEAAANDDVWMSYLFVAAAAEDPPDKAAHANAMRSSSDERARLENKARTDLGVGSANWHRGWHFSIQEGKACRPGNPYMYDQTTFNALFGKYHFSIASEEKLGTKTAWQYVQNTVGFNPVAATAYVMGKGPTFEFDGKVYVNLFDERSVPQTAKETDHVGLAAQLTIQYHLRKLFGNDASAERIESWIAMNVQKPGELIGFAPLIKGIEGDGKTIIFQELMAALIGDANVGQMSGDQLKNDYTGWAKGKAVRVIEEIKAAPTDSRHHATNKMKPYITNKKVDVVDKHVKLHETMNATNYVGMTNFANALPIKDGDRRWMVEFTQWNNIGQFAAEEGVPGLPPQESLAPYFNRIFLAIREDGPQLRKFFMEYELKQGIKWGVRAPETESKRLMIGIENSDSGLDKIKSYLEDGALGVSSEIVSTSMLNDHIARDTGEKRLITRQIATMMLDLGFVKVPWDLKWEGKTHTVYVREERSFAIGKDDQGKSMANARLRDMLDKTKTVDNEKEHVPRFAGQSF